MRRRNWWILSGALITTLMIGCGRPDAPAVQRAMKNNSVQKDASPADAGETKAASAPIDELAKAKAEFHRSTKKIQDNEQRKASVNESAPAETEYGTKESKPISGPVAGSADGAPSQFDSSAPALGGYDPSAVQGDQKSGRGKENFARGASPSIGGAVGGPPIGNGAPGGIGGAPYAGGGGRGRGGEAMGGKGDSSVLDGVSRPTIIGMQLQRSESEGRDYDSRYVPGGFVPGGEAYEKVAEKKFARVLEEPLSTFSIDVDTASYANVRRFLTQRALPPADAVRIEELVNYFTYDYAPPTDDKPFASSAEVAGCPWNPQHRLVRIGLKGKVIEDDARPVSNFVFLIDVSGSMQGENRLPLVKHSLRMLTEKLGENDRVAMVVYAGSSGLVLESTSGTEKEKILGALDKLQAGGSTNGASGIQQAYQVAVDNFIKGGVNRVILCTDGDFNVGVTDRGQLTRIIEQNAQTGVYLSILGFGMGNLKDATMEQLADKGNGNYAYIDNPFEAKKVLVEQMSGTLVTIAKDVKIQVEFNPAKAAAYRLVGYENRMLAAQDFTDDKKDAGEIGAGHTVTALYEVIPAGLAIPGTTPELKYQKPAAAANPNVEFSDELLTVKLRYKKPDGDVSTELSFPLKDEGNGFGKASPDFRWATSVAAFGMLLRNSESKGDVTLEAIKEWAQTAIGKDKNGYRREFLTLIDAALGLEGSTHLSDARR